MTDFSVASTLDAHIQRTEKPRPPDGLWHPSGIFSCDRSAVYEIRGTDASDPREPRSRRILRLGTSVHEIVQRAMTDDAQARAVYNEVEITIPSLGVYGHCDTLLEFSDDEYELLEFKSISANGFRYLIPQGQGGRPRPDHEKQARTYAMGLRLRGGHVADENCFEGYLHGLDCVFIPALGDRLRRIRVAYFSRDDLRIEEYVLDIDTAWEMDFEEEIARLDRYRADDEALPPRLPLEKGKKNWLCAGFCQFRTKCWTVDSEGVEL